MDKRQFLSLAALMPITLLSDTMDKNHSTPKPNDALISNASQRDRHTFSFSQNGVDFLLDGQPFQIRSGEMHPARIPVEYWRHRIQMAKAMGMNTIALYVMWNYHEIEPGIFDFNTENRDIEAFIRLCQEEELWVLLRPGPYICAEWDLGGLPSYLLRYSDIQLRTDFATDPRYMAAVARYINELAPRIRPLLTGQGGPVLMIQIENEFGSYANNPAYMEEIRQLWIQAGIEGPFYTQDGLSRLERNHSNIVGGAIGLSGGDASTIAEARRKFPTVPIMTGEMYPGWFTYWGDRALHEVTDISVMLNAFMQQKLSFNLYVIHGGTNFGFYAGAGTNDRPGEYRPVITSYDYAAPISEQGIATPHYIQYRNLIASHLTTPLPPIPQPINTITRSGDQALLPTLYASIWDNLPPTLPTTRTVSPEPFEMYGQAFGFALYRKTLQSYGDGDALDIKDVHDYATIFINDQYMGGVSRAAIPAQYAQTLNISHHTPLALSIAFPSDEANLDILVEGMGRINSGHEMLDRKGILKSVSLQRTGHPSRLLSGWEVFLLPMDSTFITNLRAVCSNPDKAGLFFKATFQLDDSGDTYLDMSNWTKGIVWINGRNLGRYWSIGPQKRLYCPAPWLRPGDNEITVFDLHQLDAKPIELTDTL